MTTEELSPEEIWFIETLEEDGEELLDLHLDSKWDGDFLDEVKREDYIKVKNQGTVDETLVPAIELDDEAGLGQRLYSAVSDVYRLDAYLEHQVDEDDGNPGAALGQEPDEQEIEQQRKQVLEQNRGSLFRPSRSAGSNGSGKALGDEVDPERYLSRSVDADRHDRHRFREAVKENGSEIRWGEFSQEYGLTKARARYLAAEFADGSEATVHERGLRLD